MEREDIRLEQFRQLRKEIRGSANYLVVGIDVAKDKHDAYLGTPTGKALYRRLIFENTMDGFEQLLLQVKAVQVQHSLTKVVFGMEPTANYHKPLGEFLTNKEHTVPRNPFSDNEGLGDNHEFKAAKCFHRSTGCFFDNILRRVMETNRNKKTA